jgi:two-component system, NtrC family, response regulator AtoC
VIPELAASFVAELSAELGRPAPAFSPACLATLTAHPWPGNARELRNVLERALIFHRDGPLEVALPTGSAAAGAEPADVGLPLGLTLAEVERRYLEATLARGSGGQGETAVRLGISRKTLWEKRRRYAL